MCPLIINSFYSYDLHPPWTYNNTYRICLVRGNQKTGFGCECIFADTNLYYCIRLLLLIIFCDKIWYSIRKYLHATILWLQFSLNFKYNCVSYLDKPIIDVHLYDLLNFLLISISGMWLYKNFYSLPITIISEYSLKTFSFIPLFHFIAPKNMNIYKTFFFKEKTAVQGICEIERDLQF